MSGVAERQVIVDWYPPEKHPDQEGDIVIATISGKIRGITYDHAFEKLEWWESDGWVFTDLDASMDGITIHAWCDLEPFKGEKAE